MSAEPLAGGWKLLVAGALLGVAVVLADPWERVDEEYAAMEAKLEAAWEARHPGAPLPAACDYQDIVTRDTTHHKAAVRVLTSDRFGTAMFSPSGELLAFADSRGCQKHVTKSSPLVLVDRGVIEIAAYTWTKACRSPTTTTFYRRRGDTLEHVRYQSIDDRCRNDGLYFYRSVTAHPTDDGVDLVFFDECSAWGRTCEIDRNEQTCTLRYDGSMTPSCPPLID